MIFRKSDFKDIPEIMRIISSAQKYLKEKGIDQWQNNYPNSETIKEDIQIELVKDIDCEPKNPKSEVKGEDNDIRNFNYIISIINHNNFICN